MINSNIILCGFMACGKTTIGKALALETNFNFIDTDSYIEEKFKMKIKDMFIKYGESYFRSLEHDAVKSLLGINKYIIAIGGGTILYKKNYDLLKNMGTIIFLDCPLDAIKERLKYDKQRPLAKGSNLINLFNSRLIKYNNLCDFKICADKSVPEIVKELLKHIGKN